MPLFATLPWSTSTALHQSAGLGQQDNVSFSKYKKSFSKQRKCALNTHKFKSRIGFWYCNHFSLIVLLKAMKIAVKISPISFILIADIAEILLLFNRKEVHHSTLNRCENIPYMKHQTKSCILFWNLCCSGQPQAGSQVTHGGCRLIFLLYLSA